MTQNHRWHRTLSLDHSWQTVRADDWTFVDENGEHTARTFDLGAAPLLGAWHWWDQPFHMIDKIGSVQSGTEAKKIVEERFSTPPVFPSLGRRFESYSGSHMILKAFPIQVLRKCLLFIPHHIPHGSVGCKSSVFVSLAPLPEAACPVPPLKGVPSGATSTAQNQRPPCGPPVSA